MYVLSSGLRRAMENTPERYELIQKVALKNLRVYVNSIYLVKGAEKKIKEIEIEFKKKGTDPHKRSHQDMINE
jgi:hypothetical protein